MENQITKSLYTHRSENIFKTWALMTAFLITFIALGFVFSQTYGNPNILYIFVAISLVMNFTSYFWSDRVALAQSRAVEASAEQYPQLHRIIENLAITAGLPKPRVYIIHDSSPNAFATGRDSKHAAIAVTSGLLEILDQTELEGVIAHEMSHIGNRDILIGSVVVVLVGIISLAADMFMRSMLWGGLNSDNDRDAGIGPIAIIVGIVIALLSPLVATIIQLAISRRREFLADASGAILTRYPEGLANALRKISMHDKPLESASNATAHLYISNPFGSVKNGFLNLFATHPPTEKRIQALLGQ